MGGFPESYNDPKRPEQISSSCVERHSLCVSVCFKCVHLEIFEVDGLTIFLQPVALLAFDLQDAQELGNKGL